MINLDDRQLVAGVSGDCTTTGRFKTGKSMTGGLGLSTKRRETCEQVEHLKVWRSNQTHLSATRHAPHRLSEPQGELVHMGHEGG